MKKKMQKAGYLFVILSTMLMACKKDELPHPGTQPPPPPPPGHETYFKVNVRASIIVGRVEYDSIPSQFTITTWDKNGVSYQKDTLLAAGVNEIFLPKSHSKYKFEMRKWGSTKDTTILTTDIQETVVYTIRASQAPKLLKEETTYVYSLGNFRPLSKRDYSYTGNRLSEITYHDVFLNGGVELFEPVKKEQFSYNGITLSKIKEVYLINTGSQASERTYLYDGTGRIVKTYITFPSNAFAYRNRYSLAGDDLVSVYLEGIANPAGTRYELKFEHGNRSHIKTITNADTYGYTYKYDLNINPYVHLNWPDIWFDRQSKNNVSGEKFIWGGQISEDVKYEYQFDFDGYPTEIIKRERDPLTNDFLIKSKKVFKY